MTTLPAPDQALGLFETLLILDGKPVELDAHLDRLAASLRTLFDTAPLPGLAEEVGARAADLRLGRMRIAVDRDGRAMLNTEEIDPADFFPSRERGAELRSVRCDDGLGPHKWSDRTRLDEASGAPVPLLVDRGDEILEAGRANLFAAFGDVLKTPPVDGRILPGITRAATIEVAPSAGLEVREEPLSRAELLGADEVFLTGSVRGIEPARALDGASLPTGNELGSRLGEKLLRRWRTAGNLPSRAPLRRRAAGPRSGPPAR